MSESKQLPSRRIADDLRASIESGELAANAKLPSERELAAQYGTARNTAREAVSILQAEGLVVAQHGKGVFVRPRTPLMRLGANRYSRLLRNETGMSPFRIEVMKQGRTPRAECRSVERSRPPGDVAERLGVDPESESVIRGRTGISLMKSLFRWGVRTSRLRWLATCCSRLPRPLGRGAFTRGSKSWGIRLCGSGRRSPRGCRRPTSRKGLPCRRACR